MSLGPVSDVTLLTGRNEFRGASLAADLAALLERRGITVRHERALERASGREERTGVAVHARRPDLAIVIGNDRAVLRHARQFAREGVPLLGINQDRLGFLSALPPDEACPSVERMLDGDLHVDARSMLEASVRRGGSVAFSEVALNDFVVTRSTGRLLDLEVDIDGERVIEMRADGIVVATPTGTTAYCLSVGGPVVHPAVGAWSLAPVAAHTLTNRPLVVPVSSSIRITVAGGNPATINADGLAAFVLDGGESMDLQLAPLEARFVHPPNWSYYSTLRQKLGW